MTDLIPITTTVITAAEQARIATAGAAIAEGILAQQTASAYGTPSALPINAEIFAPPVSILIEPGRTPQEKAA